MAGAVGNRAEGKLLVEEAVEGFGAPARVPCVEPAVRVVQRLAEIGVVTEADVLELAEAKVPSPHREDDVAARGEAGSWVGGGDVVECGRCGQDVLVEGHVAGLLGDAVPLTGFWRQRIHRGERREGDTIFAPDGMIEEDDVQVIICIMLC